jgi:DNA repair protein RadC
MHIEPIGLKLNGFFYYISTARKHRMPLTTEVSGIKSWAEDDRPREKLLYKGRQALSDAELIAILLGSGSRDLTAVDLAKQILAGSSNQLTQLARLQIDDLKKFKGIGEAKAITIVAALELGRRRRDEAGEEAPKIRSSKDIYEIFHSALADIDHEEFWIILLNRSHRVKDKICISRGGISGTVVDQRLIFKPAIERLASSIVLCHNHPSGNLQPSDQDRSLTKKLVQSAALLDISILDHIIFTDRGYFSFADEGLI